MKTGIGRKEDTGSEMKAGWTPPPKSFFPLFPDKGFRLLSKNHFQRKPGVSKGKYGC